VFVLVVVVVVVVVIVYYLNKSIYLFVCCVGVEVGLCWLFCIHICLVKERKKFLMKK
jgi:hypothetical protein